MKEKTTIAIAAVGIGIFISLYTREWTSYIEPKSIIIESARPEPETSVAPEPPIAQPEAWHGTDRQLTEYEWNILGQAIMAEARGESFPVQYSVACVVLNRVDSPLFPNTVAGVLYQTKPAVQFSGAWDSREYEVTDTVWEAIQAALIRNSLPEDVFYFTSEGYLPGTESWEQIGNMWFSRQR